MHCMAYIYVHTYAATHDRATTILTLSRVVESNIHIKCSLTGLSALVKHIL